MSEKNLPLPKATVKRIMKLNEDVITVSDESIILVSKATEMLVAQLALSAYKVMQSNGRKTVKYEDILTAVEDNKLQLEFLQEAFSASTGETTE
mmetsp:Transcript_16595/g.16686  ORF Transcript_16595/g.16686 Transcript_16595/m.16686 type:complete len:94 (+) Transcript_16595:116-397(+)